MRKLIAVAVVTIAVAACSSSVFGPQATPQCPQVVWSEGDKSPADVSAVIQWSMAYWALAPGARGDRAVTTPCSGGGPTCEEVIKEVESLGGDVRAHYDCAVVWNPPAMSEVAEK